MTDVSAAGVGNRIVFVGNKADLINSADPVVPESQYKGYVSSTILNQYFEVSTRSGLGIPAVIPALIQNDWNNETAANPKRKLTLHLNLQKGLVLHAQDSNGLADPYVKVKFGGKVVWTSSCQKKTLNPQWDEVGVIPNVAISGDDLKLSFELFDKDMLMYEFCG
jgi:hypothetical protein